MVVVVGFYFGRSIPLSGHIHSQGFSVKFLTLDFK